MRIFLGAAALFIVVVGGFWLALSQVVGSSSADDIKSAYAKSVRCVRSDPALSLDKSDTAKIAVPGERAIGVRWNEFVAVALFDDTSQAARGTVARLATRLLGSGVSIPSVNRRLRRRGYAVMDYARGLPSPAARAALGRCIYVVRPNRIARFFGLDITHTERPFLRADDHRDVAVRPITAAQVMSAFAREHLSLTESKGFFDFRNAKGYATIALVTGNPAIVAFPDVSPPPSSPHHPPLPALHRVHLVNLWIEYRLTPALARRTDAALAVLRTEAFD